MPTNNPTADFLPLQGHYEDLVVYQIAQCIYAITYHFAHTYLDKGDRTIDQMVQAARSGKQNIAEGSVDGSTSKEMELKLLNVARGSIHELKADYEDYLLTRGLQKWTKEDERYQKTRRYCLHHNHPDDYVGPIQQRTAETTANIALTLIHQYDVLIVRLIEASKKRFLTEGGIKEQLFRARKEYRDNHQ